MEICFVPTCNHPLILGVPSVHEIIQTYFAICQEQINAGFKQLFWTCLHRDMDLSKQILMQPHIACKKKYSGWCPLSLLREVDLQMKNRFTSQQRPLSVLASPLSEDGEILVDWDNCLR